LPEPTDSSTRSPATATSELAAPAKLNLNLLVGPRRPDGYHPLDSFVVRVSLRDHVALRRRTDGVLSLSCEGADCGPPEQNLALRAARLLQEHTGSAAGVEIELHKTIPPGRGLGGGSSDAAAVLAGLRSLWGLALPEEELARLAATLGSDVPLFLGPPACRMTGRVERIEPAEAHPFCAVLILPDLHCSTAAVYAEFDRRPEPMAPQLDAALLRRPPSAWRDRLVNQLAGPARRVCPELGRLQDAAAEAAGLPVHVTGSGSAMFLLCDGHAEAREAMDRLPPGIRRLCRLVEGE